MPRLLVSPRTPAGCVADRHRCEVIVTEVSSDDVISASTRAEAAHAGVGPRSVVEARWPLLLDGGETLGDIGTSKTEELEG